MAHTDPLSIRQLQVFVTLVEQGSFTRAARHLGLSQSTVSGHVADLERRLGMRLVGRERSGVTPTGAGTILLKPARDALRAERNARMAAAELSGVLRGSLTLGGSTIPAVYLIPGLVRAFHARHEGISVHVVAGDSGEIVEFVQGGDVDVGLVGTRPRQHGLQIERVASDDLVLIVPPEHDLTRCSAVAMDEVVKHAMVMREEGSGTRQALFDALGPRTTERDLNVVCRVGSTEAVKAFVRAGLGVSFVSSLAIVDECEAGTLATVPVNDLRVRREFFLVAREDTEISPAGRAFWTQTVEG